MSTTKISYLDKTWNFIGGCSPVAAGCKNCWACRTAGGRLKSYPLYEGLTKDGQWTGEIRLCTDIGRADLLEQPLHWREPCRIGVQFMGDLFHPAVPFEFIADVYKTAAFTEWHTYQFLTKRINRASEFFNWLENKYTYDGGALMFRGERTHWQYKPWPLPNVWLGVSISTLDDIWMVEKLIQIPAAVRVISAEPLLEDINPIHTLSYYLGDGLIHQVIVGGESGPKARPMHPNWPRNIRDQCVVAGVPFFFKQWGEWYPAYPQYSTDEGYDIASYSEQWNLDYPSATHICLEPSGYIPQCENPTERTYFCHYQPCLGSWWMYRIGKKKAGRLLDGREWNEFPKGK